MPSLTLDEAYGILGLTSSASEAEVKSAYKRLALKTHPDKNPDNPEAHKNFLQISEAYKRITDPDSFKDEEEGEMNEEEMMAMFNMMFSELFGGSDFPLGMMDMMEMMLSGDLDSDEDEAMFGRGDSIENVFFSMMQEDLRGTKHSKKAKRGVKSSKKAPNKPGTKSFSAEPNESEEDWETDESLDEQPRNGIRQVPNRGKKSSSQRTFFESLEEFEDLDGLDDEMMMFALLSAMEGDMMDGGGSRVRSKAGSKGKAAGSKTGSKKIGGKKSEGEAKKHEGTSKFTPKRDSEHVDEVFSTHGRTETVTANSVDNSKILIENSNFEIGDKVLVNGRHRGVVAFIGPVHYAKGIYVGVVMDNPSEGKNNGTVKGREYFTCRGTSGLMVRPMELSKI